MWVDVLLGVVNWILVFALVPTVLSKTEKPTLLSSLITGICLAGIASAYVVLSLWIAAVPAALQALQWGVIGYQRYRINKNSRLPIWGFTEVFRIR